MKHADIFSLEIFKTAESIIELSKTIAINGTRHGIDGKIPAEKVLAQPRRRHDWKRSGIRIRFLSGCGNIKFQALGQHHRCRLKLAVHRNGGFKLLGQRLCKKNTVSLDNKIKIEVFSF